MGAHYWLYQSYTRLGESAAPAASVAPEEGELMGLASVLADEKQAQEQRLQTLLGVAQLRVIEQRMLFDVVHGRQRNQRFALARGQCRVGILGHESKHSRRAEAGSIWKPGGF